MENVSALSMKKKPLPLILQSFKPFVHDTSKVLILGSMPGPEALRKQQYYGFSGNHFWTIIPAVLNHPKPTEYEEKLNLIRDNGIGLWDVLESCIRPGALDSAIRNPTPNKIPQLINRYPNIQAIFVNGRTAHGIFMKTFGSLVDRPVFYLPSSSPAHASLSLAGKIKEWSFIKKFL
jgi:hypoxanthine-DNA glycosylase